MKLATKYKMHIAHLLYRLLMLAGVDRSQQKVVRNGDGEISYHLDLAEGIDLSLYLFGSFQRHVVPDSIRSTAKISVFDVGANFGVMSLQYAQFFPNAQIHAFEPSEYANRRFDLNMELNPGLSARIRRTRGFVSDRSNVETPYVSYASWRVDSLEGKRHPVHFGESHPSTETYFTIDEYCEANGIDDLYMMKIDTDGYEYEVLKGASETIHTQRPFVIFELATYILEERGITFEEYVRPLLSYGYTLADLQTMKPISVSNLEKMIPKFGSIDVLATPPEHGCSIPSNIQEHHRV